MISNLEKTTPLLKPKKTVKKPNQYAVILLNDDFTPMDFVVELLMAIFSFSYTQALAIMLLIHQTGKGVCGVYTKDMAEMKSKQILDLAQQEGYPLLAVVELA